MSADKIKPTQIFVMTKAIRTVPKSYPVIVKPNQLEQADARLHSMPSKRDENEIYRVRELVIRLFSGITSMRDKQYSWEEITQWFIQEFPDAPVSPRTLQEYWRSVKAQNDKGKKDSRRSASTRSPTQSLSSQNIAFTISPDSPEIIPKFFTSTLDNSTAEVEPIDPIVDSAPVATPSLVPKSASQGYWSQEELDKHFNQY